MIKNHKQASITRDKLIELREAKASFLKESDDIEGAQYELGVKSFDSLIADFENQLNTFESLTKGKFHCLQAKTLNEIPEVLIAARLAQKLSQKQLGDIVGLKEQQLQRYESTDYETASWPRIIEISMALGLQFKFEKIIIMSTQNEDKFKYPDEITSEQANLACKKIQERGFLICN